MDGKENTMETKNKLEVLHREASVEMVGIKNEMYKFFNENGQCLKPDYTAIDGLAYKLAQYRDYFDFIENGCLEDEDFINNLYNESRKNHNPLDVMYDYWLDVDDGLWSEKLDMITEKMRMAKLRVEDSEFYDIDPIQSAMDGYMESHRREY